MKRVLILALCTVAAASQAIDINSAHTYVIEQSPYGTYASGTDKSFWSIGYYKPSTTVYHSLGAVDFNASALGVSNIGTASLTLTTLYYSKAVATSIQFWAVSDNTTNILTGAQTAVVYNTNKWNGLTNSSSDTKLTGTQFGTVELLGSIAFKPVASGQTHTDTITLSNTYGGLTLLNTLAHSASHNVRIVVTSDQLGYSEWAGATATSHVPKLTLTPAAVPEPSGVFAIGVGMLGLGLRLRRSK